MGSSVGPLIGHRVGKLGWPPTEPTFQLSAGWRAAVFDCCSRLFALAPSYQFDWSVLRLSSFTCLGCHSQGDKLGNCHFLKQDTTELRVA